MRYNWFKGNLEEFNFQEQEVAGDLCVLITPKDNTIKWNDDNKIYRSSIWRVSDGFPVSLGYKKFVNFQEQPSFEPIDDNSGYPIIVEKVDGSCIICSLYKNEFIVRTRGTFDYYSAFPNNSQELKSLVEKYKIESVLRYFNKISPDKGCSFIFEYVSPNNQIVLKYDEPDLIFTGIVYHNDYSYGGQTLLDDMIDIIGCKRPKTYNLNLLASDTSEFFKNFKDKAEGAVCYFNDGQILKKMKTDWYLNLHRMRFFFGSSKHVFQYILDNHLIDLNKSEDDFKSSVINTLSNQFDYEVVSYIKPTILDICSKVYSKVINKINLHKEYFKRLPDNALIPDVINLIKSIPDINESLIWHQYKNRPINNKLFRTLYR